MSTTDIWNKIINEKYYFDFDNFIDNYVLYMKQISVLSNRIKINIEDYPELYNIINKPYKYVFGECLTELLDAENIKRKEINNKITEVQNKISKSSGGVQRDNIELLKRLERINKIIKGEFDDKSILCINDVETINIYPINYEIDIFNDDKLMYLYHGTNSTTEIIQSKVLKSNISEGETEHKIFFGRNLRTSLEYADPLVKTNNIKKTDYPVYSVLIMIPEDKEFISVNMGPIGIESYILKGGNTEFTYDLVKNLKAIVFNTKDDVDDFFHLFSTFDEDIQKTIKNIYIYEKNYYPWKDDNFEEFKKELKTNFFEKYFKKELFTQIIFGNLHNKYTVDKNIMTIIHYFTLKCIEKNNIDILCLLTEYAVKYSILPNFIEFIKKTKTDLLEKILNHNYEMDDDDDDYKNKSIESILEEILKKSDGKSKKRRKRSSPKKRRKRSSPKKRRKRSSPKKRRK